MSEQTQAAKSTTLTILRGIGGGIVGGAIGWFVFGWAYSKGYYAMVTPGAFLGIGCGLASGRRSLPLAVIATVAALPLSLMAEATYCPWVADDSYEYFFQNLGDQPQMTWIMIAAGVFAAGWFGFGRNRIS